MLGSPLQKTARVHLNKEFSARLSIARLINDRQLAEQGEFCKFSLFKTFIDASASQESFHCILGDVVPKRLKIE